MVIHCKRLNQIPLILWGDIRDLSRILHYPGNDSAKMETILLAPKKRHYIHADCSFIKLALGIGTFDPGCAHTYSLVTAKAFWSPSKPSI
jgi:hypothetical protein